MEKKERLCSVTAIGHLVEKGRYVSSGPLRCCYLKRETVPDGEAAVRIVVSVPKKLFRRAVKRNLLKRRIREAYRLQKNDFPQLMADIMFVYSSKEMADYNRIHDSVRKLLESIR